MEPYIRWTRPRMPRELMCIECGAVRQTLHIPRLEVDPITRTFLPLFVFSVMQIMAQRAASC